MRPETQNAVASRGHTGSRSRATSTISGVQRRRPQTAFQTDLQKTFKLPDPMTGRRAKPGLRIHSLQSRAVG